MANKYKVTNNKRNTAWIVGTEIKKFSPFNNDGFALFSSCVPFGRVAIWAHKSEVEKNKNCSICENEECPKPEDEDCHCDYCGYFVSNDGCCNHCDAMRQSN
jgi:hypothetical protein